jgi:putative glutathione S-transferase
VKNLFSALDRCEDLLARSRYIAGDVFTEADVRLFMTLIRFDEVYVVYFKTNKKFIHQYEHMGAYVRELYQMPALRRATDFAHIKQHYFASHPSLNPHAIVPCGPNVDLDAAHGRDGPYPR